VQIHLLLQLGYIGGLIQAGLWIQLGYDLLQGGAKQRVIIRNQY
jgi:hypothetical protein